MKKVILMSIFSLISSSMVFADKRSIFFLRHAETDWNRSISEAVHRLKGHINLPLNEYGKVQALELKETLTKMGVISVLSSDLDRAAETMRIATSETGISLELDRRLRGTGLGEVEGLTESEVDLRYTPDLLKRARSLKREDQDVFFPGGESGRQVTLRVIQAIHEFAEKYPDGILAVCSHGSVIRRMVRMAISIDIERIPFSNSEWLELIYDTETRSLSFPSDASYSEFIKRF